MAEKNTAKSIVEYKVADLIDGNIEEKFDVIIDKGTLDAICANEDQQT